MPLRYVAGLLLLFIVLPVRAQISDGSSPSKEGKDPPGKGAEEEKAAVEKAEEELLARLTDLGKARDTEQTARKNLDDAKKALESAKSGKDQQKIKEAEAEVKKATMALERAAESLTSAQALHDQAREKYRIARQNLDARLKQNQSDPKKARSSIEELLEYKSQVDQAAVQAALAKKQVDMLRQQQKTLLARKDEIRETLPEIDVLLANRKEKKLTDSEVERLEEEKKALLSETKKIDQQLRTIREEVILAEARQRLKEEIAQQEKSQFQKTKTQIYIVGGIFLGALVVLFVSRIIVVRRITNPHRKYTVQKLFSLAFVAIILIGLVLIFAYRFSHLLTLFGLAVAGLTIALQEIVASFAAWFLIRSSRGYVVKDWIQIGDQFGEVIDIGFIRTTILQSEPFSPAAGQRGGSLTGGLTMVMNSSIFKRPLINYTQGFPFVWCTLRYTFTFESKWQRARELLSGVLKNDQEINKVATKAQKKFDAMAGDYAIEISSTQPRVLSWTADSGVELTVRFLSHPRDRVAAIDRVNAEILNAVQTDPDVDFAYTTIRSIGSSEGAQSVGLEPVSAP